MGGAQGSPHFQPLMQSGAGLLWAGAGGGRLTCAPALLRAKSTRVAFSRAAAKKVLMGKGGGGERSCQALIRGAQQCTVLMTDLSPPVEPAVSGMGRTGLFVLKGQKRPFPPQIGAGFG